MSVEGLLLPGLGFCGYVGNSASDSVTRRVQLRNGSGKYRTWDTLATTHARERGDHPTTNGTVAPADVNVKAGVRADTAPAREISRR